MRMHLISETAAAFMSDSQVGSGDWEIWRANYDTRLRQEPDVRREACDQ